MQYFIVAPKSVPIRRDIIGTSANTTPIASLHRRDWAHSHNMTPIRFYTLPCTLHTPFHSMLETVITRYTSLNCHKTTLPSCTTKPAVLFGYLPACLSIRLDRSGAGVVMRSSPVLPTTYICRVPFARLGPVVNLYNCQCRPL